MSKPAALSIMEAMRCPGGTNLVEIRWGLGRGATNTAGHGTLLPGGALNWVVARAWSTLSAAGVDFISIINCRWCEISTKHLHLHQIYRMPYIIICFL